MNEISKRDSILNCKESAFSLLVEKIGYSYALPEKLYNRYHDEKNPPFDCYFSAD